MLSARLGQARAAGRGGLGGGRDPRGQRGTKPGPARAPRMHVGRRLHDEGGGEEGGGGGRARGGRPARLGPKSPGSLHLPRCLARSPAPPRCSRPCSSRGKRAGEDVGGGLGGGRGQGQPAGRRQRAEDQVPPGLPRLLPSPHPQSGLAGGDAGAAAQHRPLHLRAGPGRRPRRRPLRVQLRLGASGRRRRPWVPCLPASAVPARRRTVS